MKKISILYVIITSILWGTSCIFVYNLTPFGLDSLNISFVRGAIAAAAMIVYVLICNRGLFKASIRELMLYCGSGLMMFLTSACYFAAMQMTTVATAVVLMYTAPVFITVYSVLFLGEKVTKTKLSAIVLMMIGCGLVSGIIGGFKYSFRGIVLGFASGLAYSGYNIFTKIQMRKKCNPITASMYCFIFMTIISGIASEPFAVLNTAVQNPQVIWWIIGCGLCTSALPYFLYTSALKNLYAGTASTLAIVEPMSATIFGMVLYSQMPDIYSLCGTVLILTAVFMLSRIKE